MESAGILGMLIALFLAISAWYFVSKKKPFPWWDEYLAWFVVVLFLLDALLRQNIWSVVVALLWGLSIAAGRIKINLQKKNENHDIPKGN